MTPQERARAASAKWRAAHPDLMRLANLVNNAKQRAKRKGLAFSITKYDIIIPETCPVLGITLTLADGTNTGPDDSSPSLDRINPALGYVPGNIRVISYRANRIRNDATVEELRAVLAYAEGLL